MRILTGTALSAALAASLLSPPAHAQTALNLEVLTGLSPFAALLNTPAGQAALAANYKITGDIQTGKSAQPALQPFAQDQAQALKDAFITLGNANELADGLGTKLGAAYQSLAPFTSKDDGKTFAAGNISPAIGNLIGYTIMLDEADSNAGKFFFANATVVTKTSAKPVSTAAAAILKQANGTTDVFGKAYRHPAGSAGADPFGDSRPFQTEAHVTKYTDPDFFGVPSGNNDYLNGPAQDLTKNPAFPSGHTVYGYTESLLLAFMVPERFPQMVTRAAEYGNHRIVLGAHYAMDVIGGRTVAYYDIAHLLADTPAYLGQTEGKAIPIANYQTALATARAALRKALAAKCGGTIAVCAADDTSRFSTPAANEAFYESTLTYGMPAVYPTAAKVEDVAKLAPQAGYLLTAAYPYLSLAQADAILTATEGPGGGFLDNGSAFGVYSRLDLYKAGIKAESLAPHKSS